MSDTPQGPGWWEASDGRWYPPQPAPQAPAQPVPQAAVPPGPPAAPYPPPGPGAPPPYRPPAPNKSGRGCLIALAIGGVVALLAVVAIVVVVARVGDEVDERVDDDGGISSLSGNTENPPEDDVTVGRCDTDPSTRYMRADLEVHNNSSEPSNYIITVAFEAEDGGRQLTTGAGVVDGLRADQSTTVEANSVLEAPDGDFTCRITRVERFAA